MKISSLSETVTPSSTPNGNNPSSAPRFGRDPKVLETTVAGNVSGGEPTNMGMQTRNNKGSNLLKGIKTSRKYANSEKAGIKEDALSEDDISEEQLLDKHIRQELFNKAKARDIGNRPEDRDIMAKEEFDGGGEYNDEVDMVQNNLHTIVRVSTHLGKELQADENMPEWVQEKIAVAKSMMVTVMDYMISQHERGNVFTVDMDEGQLEYNTPDPVIVVQDLKGNILDKMNLSLAVQKYKLGQPQNIKNQLAHQNYTKIGNYTIVSPMTGQPQDKTTQNVPEGSIVEEDMDGQVVYCGTGGNGSKYEIIKSGPYDYMIHADGKHIDTYSSLQRAMNVLNNEVSGLKKDVEEAGYGRNRGYSHGFASPTAPSLGGRRHREDDEGWDREEREQSQNWYIRINGKLLKDKQMQPYTFSGKQAAEKAARTMMAKEFNKGKKFVLTTNAEDNIDQGMAEAKPDFASKFKKKIDKHNKAVVKTNKEIGTRVADIGAGGKEYNVKTDKEWDKQKGVAEGDLDPSWMNKQHQDFYDKNPNFKRDDREVTSVGDRIASKVSPMNKPVVTKKPITNFREEDVSEESKGLWANIHAKRERIKHGSGEKMRKPGSKGAPTADALRKSAK